MRAQHAYRMELHASPGNESPKSATGTAALCETMPPFEVGRSHLGA